MPLANIGKARIVALQCCHVTLDKYTKKKKANSKITNREQLELLCWLGGAQHWFQARLHKENVFQAFKHIPTQRMWNKTCSNERKWQMRQS